MEKGKIGLFTIPSSEIFLRIQPLSYLQPEAHFEMSLFFDLPYLRKRKTRKIGERRR
jgi:hypothetical protein